MSPYRGEFWARVPTPRWLRALHVLLHLFGLHFCRWTGAFTVTGEQAWACVACGLIFSPPQGTRSRGPG